MTIFTLVEYFFSTEKPKSKPPLIVKRFNLFWELYVYVRISFVDIYYRENDFQFEKNWETCFFGIFEKRVTLTIHRVIDYFRDLKTCTDPEIFSKGGGVESKAYFRLFN